MKKELSCLRCGGEMRHIRDTEIQLGEYGRFTGHYANIKEGAIEVSLYACPECGKIEFYHATPKHRDGTPQIRCSYCGKQHDFDDPRCPFCKTDTL